MRRRSSVWLPLLVAFAGGMAASNCKYRQGEEFNEQAAEFICRAVTECDKSIRTGQDLVEAHAGCKLELMNALDECDANCEFHPTAARSCIRELEISSECKRDPAQTRACTKVYTGCDEEFFEREMCRLDVPTCAVIRPPRAPAPVAWGLLLLLGLGRRTRRRR